MKNTFENPVLRGDFADPSILRMGKDYYMVHSSFKYAPGLLIWHSEDLINWKPLCRALTEYAGDVWAPDLQFIDGKFYIYFPASGKNYVIYADKIEGPWSEPIDTGAGFIDPGFVRDVDTGEKYLHVSGGHMRPLCDDNIHTCGETQKVYSGWDYPDEWEVEGPALESPKLFYKDGWYYLTCAHGGTAGPATSHMVISARSKTPTGPWENSPYNPIVHTSSAEERWWSKGHGTVFEKADGTWWMMLHAYEKGYYTLGRQTLLLPVEWTDDGWFYVPEEWSMGDVIPMPEGAKPGAEICLSDDFSGDSLGIWWAMYGEYDKARFTFGDGLTLKAKNVPAQESGVLAVNPMHRDYEVQVTLETNGNSEGGLLLFYSPEFFVGLGYDGKYIYQKQFRLGNHKIREICTEKIHLKIRNKGQVATLFYSTDGETWHKNNKSFEISGYNHNVFGGFLNLRPGIYSSGEGSVTFRDFKYNLL